MACTATPVGAACETDVRIVILYATNHTLHCWCVVIEGHARRQRKPREDSTTGKRQDQEKKLSANNA